MGPDFKSKIRGYWLTWFGPVPLPERGVVEYKGAVTVTDDAVNGRTVVAIGGAGTSAAFDSLEVTGSGTSLLVDDSAEVDGNLTVGGAISQGGLTSKTGSGSTTGPSAATMMTFALANAHTAIADLRVVGRSTGGKFATFDVYGLPFDVTSSTLSTGAPALAATADGFGLPCALLPSWSAGTLSIPVTGPSGVITGASSADAGASTLITCSGAGLGLTTGITTDITGQGVTISGVVGGTGINGAHAGGTIVWVSATSFKITGLAWAGWTSGGVVVLTTPPVIDWEASASTLISPRP